MIIEIDKRGDNLKNKLLAASLLLLAGILMVSCADVDNNSVFARVKERLKLTDQQAVLVKPIFDEQIQKATAIIKEARKKKSEGSFDYSHVFQASREAGIGLSGVSLISGEAPADPLIVNLRALSKETQQKLTPILTADQIAEYNKMVGEQIEQLKKAQNDQGGGRGRGRGGRHRGGFSGGRGMPGGGF